MSGRFLFLPSQTFLQAVKNGSDFARFERLRSQSGLLKEFLGVRFFGQDRLAREIDLRLRAEPRHPDPFETVDRLDVEASSLYVLPAAIGDQPAIGGSNMRNGVGMHLRDAVQHCFRFVQSIGRGQCKRGGGQEQRSIPFELQASGGELNCLIILVDERRGGRPRLLWADQEWIGIGPLLADRENLGKFKLSTKVKRFRLGGLGNGVEM